MMQRNGQTYVNKLELGVHYNYVGSAYISNASFRCLLWIETVNTVYNHRNSVCIIIVVYIRAVSISVVECGPYIVCST